MKREYAAVLGLMGMTSCAGAPPPTPVPAPAAPQVASASTPPAPPVPSAKGLWLGTLHAGSATLRVQVHLDPDDKEHGCSLDSLDQHGWGIPCHYVPGAGNALTLDVPAVHGNWTGAVAADGNTLTGTWTQGGPSMPLVLTREDKAIEPQAAEMLPAMAPVDVAALQAVLDADIAPSLAKGDLAPATGAGVAIGVVQKGVRRIFSYGAVNPDSVFEIGSITKTFTGLILAQMAAQKKVRLDEPVRELLPAGTVAKPDSGAEITLLDLSDQHSGLPRMPDNFHPADPSNPYADYTEKSLFGWLGSHGVGRSADAPFGYSNLGVGLLGAALSRRAGASYEVLLRQQVTGPLGMKETVITLTPALSVRLAPGHDAEHKSAHAWDIDALAGAGGIRSTAADMLTYLVAQLHPEKLPPTAAASAAGKTLASAIQESHVVRAEAGEKMQIALNWMRVIESGTYWHNGGTGGYSSCALFDPTRDFAVVVLSNTAASEGSFADSLAAHIGQRLKGLPAVSLAPPQ